MIALNFLDQPEQECCTAGEADAAPNLLECGAQAVVHTIKTHLTQMYMLDFAPVALEVALVVALAV